MTEEPLDAMLARLEELHGQVSNGVESKGRWLRALDADGPRLLRELRELREKVSANDDALALKIDEKLLPIVEERDALRRMLTDKHTEHEMAEQQLCEALARVGGPADVGTLRDCTDCGRPMVWKHSGGDYAGSMVCPRCTVDALDALRAENERLADALADIDGGQLLNRNAIKRLNEENALLRDIAEAAKAYREAESPNLLPLGRALDRTIDKWVAASRPKVERANDEASRKWWEAIDKAAEEAPTVADDVHEVGSVLDAPSKRRKM